MFIHGYIKIIYNSSQHKIIKPDYYKANNFSNHFDLKDSNGWTVDDYDEATSKHDFVDVGQAYEGSMISS